MEQYLTRLEPINWRDPGLEYPGPAGNHLASGLKRIHDDSASVFPESVYTSVDSENNRWRSLYDSEFIPLGWVDKRGIISAGQSANNMRPMAATKRNGNSAESMQFMSWKVPSRLTDDGHRDVESRLSSSGHKSARAAIPTPAVNKTNNTTQLPQIETCPPPQSARPINEPVRSARKQSPRKPKAMAATQLLSANSRGPLYDATPNTSLGQVEQALRLAAYEKSGFNDHAKKLSNWVKTATDAEREVAVKFFNTLVTSLMEEGSPEQKQKMKQIMSMLKRNSGGTKATALPLVQTVQTSDDLESRLRYLRLLSPKTRKNRWMHQTWHHMPKYKDDNPVANTSAMYTQPGKTISRHFTIHPDWGV